MVLNKSIEIKNNTFLLRDTIEFKIVDKHYYSQLERNCVIKVSSKINTLNVIFSNNRVSPFTVDHIFFHTVINIDPLKLRLCTLKVLHQRKET